MTNKNAKCETVKPFVFFFALACERIFIKMHSTEGRCVIEPENILFLRRVLASFSLERFTGWGSQEVKEREKW